MKMKNQENLAAAAELNTGRQSLKYHPCQFYSRVRTVVLRWSNDHSRKILLCPAKQNYNFLKGIQKYEYMYFIDFTSGLLTEKGRFKEMHPVKYSGLKFCTCKNDCTSTTVIKTNVKKNVYI
jgi:hypothetical protein